MQLWHKLFRSNKETFRREAYEDVLKTATAARQALDGGADPREDADINKLFTLLWQDNLLPLLITRAVFIRANAFAGLHLNASLSQIPFRHELQQIIRTSYARQQGSLEAYYIKELSDFVHANTPVRPSSRTACYDAVIAGLRASLRHNMQELRLSDEVFPIAYLNDGLQICLTLQAVETHDVCCELLVSAREAITTEQDSLRIAPLEQTRRDLRMFLASLPPEQIPSFWQMLVDPFTSEEAWPVVAIMRQPRAVPFLLAALPALPDDGKAHVIVTLQNLRDARAVPTLQHLAQDKTSGVAPLARTAVASILQHSRSDAALLLRATDWPRADQTGDTLLRAADAAPNTTPPAELLRPDTQAVNAFRDECV
jgi:hypothetical protein